MTTDTAEVLATANGDIDRAIMRKTDVVTTDVETYRALIALARDAERYREALEWYAKQGGKRARAALNTNETEG